MENSSEHYVKTTCSFFNFFFYKSFLVTEGGHCDNKFRYSEVRWLTCLSFFMSFYLKTWVSGNVTILYK
jgi:hypothetical protein